MARKGSKSVKTPKKDTSFGVSTKKGGKVLKKLPDSKAKKKVEAQIKHERQSKGKQNKNQITQISPANSSRRSSRTSNSVGEKKSITPMSRRTTTTVASSKKLVSSPRATKVKASSKKTSDSTVQPEIKKRGNATKTTPASQKSNKHEISVSDRKMVGNKMSLRGKKRSYAQLASGDNTGNDNVTKKRKIPNTRKDLTSRGNRSIRPTVKGSEWRNTILQKKSVGSKQDKTTKPVLKSPSKKIGSAIANKSPNQNKKTMPSKTSPAKPTPSKTSIKEGSKKSSKTKPQTRERIATQKVQKRQSAKAKVQKSTKIDSVSSKSPRPRNTNRKSSTKQDENKVKASRTNNLASSIKKKYNTCVSNKRKSRGSDLQENVLTAQDILNDILNSVGTPDIFPSDEQTKHPKEVKSSKSNSQVAPLNIFDKDELGKGDVETNNDVPTEATNTVASETNLNSAHVEDEKCIIVTENVVGGLVEETSCNKPDDSKFRSDKSGAVEILHPEIETTKVISCKKEEPASQNENKDITVEEMDLHLSFNSVTSLNESELVSSENKTSPRSYSGLINKTGNDGHNEQIYMETNSGNVLGFTSKEDIKEEQSMKENIKELKYEKICTYSVTLSDSNAVITSQTEKNMKEKVSLSKPDISADTLEVVKENSNCSMNPTLSNKKSCEEKKDNIISNKNEENDHGLIKQINPREKENIHSETNLNSTTGLAELCGKKDDTPDKSLISKIDKKENLVHCEIKSCNEFNSVVGHQDAVNSDTNKVSEKKEKHVSETIVPTFITDSLSTSFEDRRNKQVDSVKSEENKLNKHKNSLFMSNGDSSSQENDDGMIIGSSQEQRINKGMSSISGEDEEVRLSDTLVGEVSTTHVQNDTQNLKDSSALFSNSNLKSGTLNSDDHCLKNEEQVDMKAATFEVESSNHSHQDELKSKKIHLGGSRPSEQLSVGISNENSYSSSEENNKIMSNSQNVSNDHKAVPDKVEFLNSVEENSIPQDVIKEKHSEVDVHFDSSGSTKSISQCASIPSTMENDSPTNRIDSTLVTNVIVNSSNLTEDVQNITLQSPNSSSQVEQISVNETLTPVTDQCSGNSSNLTEDVQNITLQSQNSSSESEVEKIAVSETLAPVTDQSSENCSHQTLEKEERPDSSTENEGIVSSNTEMAADVDVGGSEIREEFTKMEEVVQEETTRESIVIDDTDGESMQCNSETCSSNRMSVDEENHTMEVDSEELANNDVNSCSTNEIKVDSEMCMEVT